jgi:ubiquinone biosynthesis protein
LALVLARHGLGHVLDGGAPAERRERLAARVARVLAELGPTYIKLGQLLATREDLFPPDVTRALGALHADVPPMKPAVLLRVARRALGQPLETVFAWFDPSPLAAASIGQVHRARLRNGDPVVVKVQRPGLGAQVAADLALLRQVAALLAWRYPEIAAWDPPSLVDAFERSLAAELDFRGEAQNAEKLAAALEDAPEVRVPMVYAEWTRRDLLVMEWVQGRRLDALSVAERADARRHLLRAFSRQVLDHGLFHADPHPGNMLIEDDGRLVLLDLGAVDALARPLRRKLGRLVRALALRRTHALTQAVLELSPPPQPIDRPQLRSDLGLLVGDLKARKSGARILSRMVAIGRTYRLRMPPTLVALVRALALLDGVLRNLDPGRDVVGDLRREFVIAMFRRLLSPLRWFRIRVRRHSDRLRRLFRWLRRRENVA